MTKTLEKISFSSKEFFLDGGFKGNNINSLNLEINRIIHSRSISNEIKNKFMSFYKDIFTKGPFIKDKRNNEIKNNLNSIIFKKRKNKREINNKNEIKETPKKSSLKNKKKVLVNYFKNIKIPNLQLNIENNNKNIFPIPYNKRNNSFRIMSNKVFGNGNTFLYKNNNKMNLINQKRNSLSNRNYVTLTQQNTDNYNLNNLKVRLD